MHEIITIQLGQKANYLATHFWNTQESYFTYSDDQSPSPINHDIHFRPGLSPSDNYKTETFTPRTLIYDLKGAFGTLRKLNALYQLESNDDDPSHISRTSSLWLPTHQPILHQSHPPIPASPYTTALDLGVTPPKLSSSDIKFFSDYNRVYYHPRSILQLNDYESQSTIQPFESYSTGEDLFKELDKEHDILDRDLRSFLEESDAPQGIQLFTSLDDAWAGFASKYLERIRDEVGGKTGVWVFGLQEKGNRGKGLQNKVRGLTEVYRNASVVVDLALAEGGNKSMWERTGVITAGIESCLLGTRLRDGSKRIGMGALGDNLNALGGQRIVGLGMGWERVEEGDEGKGDFRLRKKGLGEEEVREGVRLGIRFDPVDGGRKGRRGRGKEEDEERRVFSQVVGVRGYEEDEEEERVEKDEMGRRMRRSAFEPVTTSWTTSLAFPILDSFPEVFTDENDEGVMNAVSITTSLSADSSIYKRLKTLRENTISSIALEDRETLGNDLMEIADEYHEGWSSGSDDGEDD
ncbi:tubulin domain-containing protein [Podospora fimiseda]|uniref:Tubulin domain-containing protein n=1 Tax=Podospora fimiseda TaxID=252190 RepID=A0AAN7H5P9_9PEZI|nr:tubulin domain-containing protein [Podospora fimiseda]